MGAGSFDKPLNAAWFAAAVLAVWPCNPRPAVAAEPVVAAMSDEGSLGSGCVDAEVVERSTSALTGRRVFGDPERAHVRVTLQVAGPHSATIVLHDPERRPLGRRTLSATSCDELTQALSLALSLMLDFTTEEVERLRVEEDERLRAEEAERLRTEKAERLRSEEAERQAGSSEADSPRNGDSAPETAVRTRGDGTPDALGGELPGLGSPGAPSRLLVFGEGRAGLGFAPGPIFALGVAASLAKDDLGLLRLDGAYWLPLDFAGESGDVELTLWEVGLAIAPALYRAGRLGTFAGIHGSVGSAQLTGRDYPVNAGGRSLVVRAGAVALAELDLRPVVAQVSAQIATPVVGYRAVVAADAGRREEFGISPVLFSCTVGVGVPLW